MVSGYVGKAQLALNPLDESVSEATGSTKKQQQPVDVLPGAKKSLRGTKSALLLQKFANEGQMNRTHLENIPGFSLRDKFSRNKSCPAEIRGSEQ